MGAGLQNRHRPARCNFAGTWCGTVQVFAADPFRVLYVSAELPVESTLEQRAAVGLELESIALSALEPGELRESIVYAGQQFTNTELLSGANYSQVFLSLKPLHNGMRSTRELIASVEKAVGTRLGNASTNVVAVEEGPPVGSPINVKIRGTNFDEIETAVGRVRTWIESTGDYKNVATDFKVGSPELKLSLNGDAIKRAGLTPDTVTTSLQAYADGNLLTQYQHLGEEVKVRLKARLPESIAIEDLLQQTIVDANNNAMALSELLDADYGQGLQNIRHYNFRRATI